MANYALTSPNQRAFDPSALETTIASQLSGPAGNQLTGYLFGALGDRYAGAANYVLALDKVNRAQMQSNERAAALEGDKLRYSLTEKLLSNPGSASMFALSKPEIAQGQEGMASAFTDADLSLKEAEAFKMYGQGASSFDAAGVRAPMGAQYSLSGAPTVPLSQTAASVVGKGGSGSGSGSGTLTAAQQAVAERAYTNAMLTHDARIRTLATAKARAEEAVRKDEGLRLSSNPAELQRRVAEAGAVYDQLINEATQTAPQREGYYPAGYKLAAPSGARTAAPTADAPTTTTAPTQLDGAALKRLGEKAASDLGGTFKGVSSTTGELVIVTKDGKEKRINPRGN